MDDLTAAAAAVCRASRKHDEELAPATRAAIARLERTLLADGVNPYGAAAPGAASLGALADADGAVTFICIACARRVSAGVGYMREHSEAWPACCERPMRAVPRPWHWTIADDADLATLTPRARLRLLEGGESCLVHAAGYASTKSCRDSVRDAARGLGVRVSVSRESSEFLRVTRAVD